MFNSSRRKWLFNSSWNKWPNFTNVLPYKAEKKMLNYSSNVKFFDSLINFDYRLIGLNTCLDLCLYVNFNLDKPKKVVLKKNVIKIKFLN